MDIILVPLINIATVAISLFIWALIIQAIMSWLVAFNIVNPYNKVVYTVGDVLNRITEPALRPIRSFLPPMGGLDLSPLVLIFVLWFLRDVLARLAFRLGGGF